MHLQILFQSKENPKGQGNIFRELCKDRCATLKLRCWDSHESCIIFSLFCIWHSHSSIRWLKQRLYQEAANLTLDTKVSGPNQLSNAPCPEFQLQGASRGCSTLFYVAISLFQCAVQATVLACKLLLHSLGWQLPSSHCGIFRALTHLSVFPLSSHLTTLCKRVSGSKWP